MHTYNRRTFVTGVLAGTAALAAVGRACADAPTANAGRTNCANCQYYTATGSAAGTCAFAGGKPVAADGGCGNFESVSAR